MGSPDEGPALGILHREHRLVAGHEGDGLRAPSRKQLDRDGVVRLEPGGQLDQPDSRGRLALGPLGAGLGRTDFAIEPGDDVTGLDPGLGAGPPGSPTGM